MVRAGKTTGRPPVKQLQIVAELRLRIINGSIPASRRLPTREELCRQYDASSVTVQQAINRLADDGFVVARGALGTFVADHPPHLSNYAMVVDQMPGNPGYGRFWTAIENEAEKLHRGMGVDLRMFHGVEAHIDNEPFQKLVTDVKHHRLAGVIFLHPPFNYVGTPLLDEPGIPRVAYMLDSSEYPTVQAFYTNYDALVQRALDYLASRGRKRVAMITQPFLPGFDVAWLQKLVTDRGMFMEPYWLQFATTGIELAGRYWAQLLMNPNQTVRPDGLIIADDNFVEAVSAGLVRSGVRVPDDLEVVAHCNFPWPTTSVLPVKRLGYSARQVLRACIDSIDAQRRGEGVQPTIQIPALFEEEVAE
jgi:DNA-binding LacI/PurR family transcriptional regulator